MDLSADKVAVILGALATFIPAVLGALKTYKNSGDTDKRLSAQDAILEEMRTDQKRAFRDQGEHKYKMEAAIRDIRQQMGETRMKLDKVPTRTEFNYRREGTMELTPLPEVVPRQDPITEKIPIDPYPGLDDEFKPGKKKKR